jgi:hypothetical protein
VPDQKRYVPNYFRELPDTKRYVPKSFRELPKRKRYAPNYFRELPDEKRYVPKRFRELPKTFREALFGGFPVDLALFGGGKAPDGLKYVRGPRQGLAAGKGGAAPDSAGWASHVVGSFFQSLEIKQPGFPEPGKPGY